MELLDNMIKSAMTLETKRWRSLPWNFPLNHRKMREGEVVDHMIVKTEGVYRWTISNLPGGTVETDHEKPYTTDSESRFDSFEPSSQKGEILFIEEVNGFGPDDRPWRWREKNKR
jgi:hypothetical protein